MYTQQDAHNLDIDWFARDIDGHIGRFSTGGRALPPLPARNNRAGNEQLISVTESLPSRYACAVVQNVAKIVPGVRDEERYLADFKAAASRGLYCFDILERLADGSSIYVCVAAPNAGAVTTGAISEAGVQMMTILHLHRFHLDQRVLCCSDGTQISQLA